VYAPQVTDEIEQPVQTVRQLNIGCPFMVAQVTPEELGGLSRWTVDLDPVSSEECTQFLTEPLRFGDELRII
jgi:hypothetical protein